MKISCTCLNTQIGWSIFTYSAIALTFWARQLRTWGPRIFVAIVNVWNQWRAVATAQDISRFAAKKEPTWLLSCVPLWSWTNGSLLFRRNRKDNVGKGTKSICSCHFVIRNTSTPSPSHLQSTSCDGREVPCKDRDAVLGSVLGRQGLHFA